MSTPLPALFLGHGNPMNALHENAWTRAWAAIGTALPRPRAVLAVSAHWYVPFTAVTAMASPRTIKHVFPDASVPVAQLSIDETRAADFHHELGARLRPLRDEGVLILGSGDIVHNLHAYAWGGHPREPYDWATRFEARVRERLEAGEHAPLIDYGSLGKDALLSVPTPEHYLPLLYVLGASFPGEPVTFPVDGVDGGSVSMLAVQFG
ncbi:MAG: dioxygenase [Gammaproteobacteria bacterium]|nr:MAG: dioxygenase [Gammaproteobacteria bacterium]